MEDVLDEVVSSEDLKKFERVYHEQLHASNVTQNAQFEYAWCLVRSKYSADIRKGIILLEDLFNKEGEALKRDCIYYLAIGNARIKEYTKALSYVRAFLQIEPGNQQVQHLETTIKKKMEKEGLVGMAVAGGVIIGLASILGLGIAMAKKG
ncbi:mitochondrial fission 1 protein [Neodiprion pinetum]|uniref:Mitochondrial fission 1 protein n=1 Tax=Neodiprion lecontei TaxID=441921 RepID=A0A6J0BCA9_NEOLC|nr:mitochondrial fission 1 protein [Neodiprion lecontei]XP_046412129.1 mitochondrial fission 1 protein [Neodiprion fabricii]XP_046467654.1 mitochondrial fission 1 protein [Neodiprion pinetum]XP_046605375.1 mitochondrial fission 1 protein [Neodiprion virginianus]XP_046736594.1 mitochondrial fission 1 protein [Diprion similis]